MKIDPQSTILLSASSYLRTGNFILDSILMSILASVIYYLWNNLSLMTGKIRNFSWGSFWLEYRLNSYQRVCLTYKNIQADRNQFSDSFSSYNDLFAIKAIFYKINTDIQSPQGLPFKGSVTFKPKRNYFGAKQQLSLNQLNKQGSLLVLPSSVIQYKDFYIKYNQTFDAENNKEKIAYQEYKNLTIFHPNDLDEINQFIKECIDIYTDHTHPDMEYTPIYAIKYSDKIWEKFDKMMCNEKIERPLNEFFYYDFKPRKSKDDVFFPEKDLLFKKYEEFLKDDKQDKFCVLLTGKPGVGKTSCIEAFAKEFELSIIESRIDDFVDDQELLDFFHNENIYQKKKIIKEGENFTQIKIPIEKRIYVFEDFDASSKIVLDREKFQFSELKSECDMSSLLSSNDSKSDSDSSDSENEEDDLIDKKLLTDDNKKNKKNKKDNKGDEFDFTKMKKSGITKQILQSKITLKSLLNIFGGILKLKKCVIFITTNHVDVLDPALIRPGRVNIRIDLDKMIYEDKVKMIEHLNPEIDLTNLGLSEILKQVEILPCKLEQYCRISRNTQEFILHLKDELPPKLI